MLHSSLDLSCRPRLVLPSSCSSFCTLARSLPPARLDRRRRRRIGICRAEMAVDAPFAVAIGACMLHSLLFADTGGVSSEEEEERGGVAELTDARFAVMTVLSLIPFCSPLSWMFVWLDTAKHCYAMYSIVYLAPYLRSNMSLSPDKSWLPIVSVVLCIIHIQIEAGTENNNIESNGFFSKVVKLLSPAARRKDGHQRTEKSDVSTHQHIMDEIRKFGMPQKPSQDNGSARRNSEAVKKKEH